jgi:Ca-activated chloride channel homolog
VPPDLFAEQPLVLLGRKRDRLAGQLHLSGTAAGGIPYQQTFLLSFTQPGNLAIAQLWGRARLKDLMNQMVSGETKRGVEAVTETALAYQLLSQYTAFVAVSDEVRVNPADVSVSVQVPVEMPQGVSYEGIFGGVAYSMAAPGSMRPTARRAQPPQAPMAAPSPAMSSSAGFDLSLISPSMIAKDSDDYDLSLISPSLIEDDAEVSSEPDTIQRSPIQPEERKSRPIAQSKPSLPDINLTIVSSSGLNTEAIASLTLHLQDLKLRLKALQTNFGWQGRVLFKLEITKGRVQQVLLDEERSSLQEATLLEEVRRSLLTWRPSKSVTGHVYVILLAD